MFEEGDVKRSSVEVAAEVEQVDFENGLVGTRAGEGRAETEAADAAEAAAVDHRFDRVDTNGGEKVGGGREVGRREAMGAGEFSSVHDDLADEVGVAEHGLGVGEATITDNCADARAGDRFAGIGDWLRDDNTRPVLAADCGKELRRAARACAEAPVCPAVDFGDLAG